MNVFYVSQDPREAASTMVDRHVVKMILESAQLLSTAHRLIDGEEYYAVQNNRKIRRWKLSDGRENVFYQATHWNHPSAVWCRASIENYIWLADHLLALGEEYKYRYNKTHLTIQKMGLDLQSPPMNLKQFDFFPPPPAMAPEYIISEDSVENYRNYYNKGKTHLHRWTKRNKPEWIT